jgi:hypothetical protein
MKMIKHFLTTSQSFVLTWWRRFGIAAFILVVLIGLLQFFVLPNVPQIDIHLTLGGREPSATWTKTGPGILEFKGTWGNDYVSTLKPLLNEPINLIRITASSGGWTDAAIGDATLLIPFKPRIVVEEECASSCANYLLPIARKIEVRNGALIGYHGDVCEQMPESESCTLEKHFWQSLPNGATAAELPIGIRRVSLPKDAVVWMPTEAAFKRANFDIEYDWAPKVGTIINGYYISN